MPDEEQDDGLHIGDDDTPIETQKSLEDKYREQMRQIMPQKIELPISTLPQMIAKQINLNPEFQRRGRWDQERRSRFIESLIMNVPIPPVFLGEDEYGLYVVLDGRQRLTAVHEFLKNTYTLRGLKVWQELNGKTFDDMEKKKLDRFLTRRFIPAVLILKESSPQVKYDVFDRLNTGGVIANAMEIRNAVFQGGFTTLLRDLSGNPTFRRLLGIPSDDAQRENNSTYTKMADLELVLRFFALQQPEEMSLKFIDHLSDFMEVRNRQYKEDTQLPADDRLQFETAVKNCAKVLGEHAFMKTQIEDHPSGKRSAPLADAFLIALSGVSPPAITEELAEIMRQALHNLLRTNEEFRNAIDTGTNGKGAIKTRVRAAQRAVQEALQQSS